MQRFRLPPSASLSHLPAETMTLASRGLVAAA
jgi:hypothetical protein